MDIRISSSAPVIAPKTADSRPAAPDNRVSRAANLAPAAPQPVQATKATPAEPALGEVQQAVKDINSSLRALSRGLEFSIDTGSKLPVVKVIDQQTQQVIRQMPTLQALEFATSLDRVLGKFLSEKA